MLWFEASILVLLAVLVVVGILLAGRSRAISQNETSDENTINLDEKSNKGKKKQKGHIRKRKAGSAEPSENVVDDFTMIDRSIIAMPHEEQVTADAVPEQIEDEMRPLETVDKKEAVETVSNLEQTQTSLEESTIFLPEIETTTQPIKREDEGTTEEKKEERKQEKKPLPQSPVPRQRKSAPPSETLPSPNWAQETFLSNCQNADKCAECDQYFTFLWRRHHCRKCYHSVCATCSANFATLPGFTEPVRVCNSCWKLVDPSRSAQEQVGEGNPPDLIDEGGEEEEDDGLDINPFSPLHDMANF